MGCALLPTALSIADAGLVHESNMSTTSLVTSISCIPAKAAAGPRGRYIVTCHLISDVDWERLKSIQQNFQLLDQRKTPSSSSSATTSSSPQEDDHRIPFGELYRKEPFSNIPVNPSTRLQIEWPQWERAAYEGGTNAPRQALPKSADPITSFLSVPKNREFTVSFSSVDDLMASNYLAGLSCSLSPVSYLVSHLEVVGDFTIGGFPAYLTLHDVPGSLDFNVERNREREKALRMASAAVVVWGGKWNASIVDVMQEAIENNLAGNIFFVQNRAFQYVSPYTR
tara:strand:- start:778 stop:1626 length:849 start_codon:yes stop_codon:yes gene_type:complete